MSGGRGLHAEATGPPGAASLVFLHGVGTSGWMWWRQVPAFADHRCLAVDLPGHGRSRDLPWTSLADTAERVADVVSTRTASGTAHLVGLSLGGYVVLSLLEHHPAVVDHAVISGVTDRPWPHRWLLPAQTRLTTTMLRSRRLVAAQARSLGLPAPAQAAFADGVRAMSAATYHRIAREVSCYQPSAALSGVSTPTLVLAGAGETEVIRRTVRTLPALLPSATGRLVPGAGHGWNVEQPDLFNATVRAWVEDRPLPPALATG